MVLPEFGPIERVCVASGNVQPLGQMLSVAFAVLAAGLSDAVSLSMMVSEEAKV